MNEVSRNNWGLVMVHFYSGWELNELQLNKTHAYGPNMRKLIQFDNIEKDAESSTDDNRYYNLVVAWKINYNV